MDRITVNERVQEAMDAIMNGGFGSAEWCLSGHEKECLGTFEGNEWVIDAEEEVSFLKMFIEAFTAGLTNTEEWYDYRQDCAANIRAAATLIEEIMSTLW